MSQADHQERGNKNDDSTDGDLKKGQFFRLDAQAKEWSDKIIKGVHSEKSSRRSRLLRVSALQCHKSANAVVGEICGKGRIYGTRKQIEIHG